MNAETIIAQIDAWLEEYAWRLDDTAIDFALDMRQAVTDLEDALKPMVLDAA